MAALSTEVVEEDLPFRRYNWDVQIIAQFIFSVLLFEEKYYICMHFISGLLGLAF